MSLIEMIASRYRDYHPQPSTLARPDVLKELEKDTESFRAVSDQLVQTYPQVDSV